RIGPCAGNVAGGGNSFDAIDASRIGARRATQPSPLVGARIELPQIVQLAFGGLRVEPLATEEPEVARCIREARGVVARSGPIRRSRAAPSAIDTGYPEIRVGRAPLPGPLLYGRV